ncbi:hypothetical protein [Stappia sp. ES.058]|uniref:hypothetical protein n=1 Tax=Stappia sp. ES.058 TaxID=1881061 RepID=UPI0012FDF27D|nr:hypothetical protein [Stappia sp. ES.058]
MYGYHRFYKTGRAVTSLLESIGWLIVSLGVIVALAGFVSGGLMGMTSRNFGGGSVSIIFRIIASVPGILVVGSGLMSIMLAQHTKATIDTSEMTRELLDIARGEPSRLPASSTEIRDPFEGYEPLNSRSGNDTSDFDSNGYRVYRGMTIQKVENRYYVGQDSFSTLGKAKKFINERT